MQRFHVLHFFNLNMNALGTMIYAEMYFIISLKLRRSYTALYCRACWEHKTFDVWMQGRQTHVHSASWKNEFNHRHVETSSRDNTKDEWEHLYHLSSLWGSQNKWPLWHHTLVSWCNQTDLFRPKAEPIVHPEYSEVWLEDVDPVSKSTEKTLSREWKLQIKITFAKKSVKLQTINLIIKQPIFIFVKLKIKTYTIWCFYIIHLWYCNPWTTHRHL